VITALFTSSTRTFRTLALWLGLTALIVQGLAPLCAGFMTEASAGVPSIVICTAHGSQTVQIGADGKAVPAAPLTNAGDCCSVCSVPGGFALPSPILVAMPSSITATYLPAVAAPVIGQRFYFSYLTRGPPAAANSFEFA
jgi:hypothetical protein